jgi:imidazolonepropionase-like amidohydrolase
MAKSAASSRGVEARLSARLSAKAKADEVWPGMARTCELAKKYKIKTAWGSDVLFSQALAQQQGAILASLVRWYSPAEALATATRTNAELLALSGSWRRWGHLRNQSRRRSCGNSAAAQSRCEPRELSSPL